MFRCKLICWSFVVICLLVLVGEYIHQLLIFFSLLDRLDGVRFENEEINVIAKNTGNKQKLNQKKW